MKYYFFYLVFQILLRCRLRNILGHAGSAAGHATDAAACILVLCIDLDVFGLKSKLLGVEDTHLDIVSLVMTPLICEEVHILSLYCLHNNWSQLIPRGYLVIRVLILLDLFGRETYSIYHGDKNDLIALDLFDEAGVDLLEEWTAVRHSQVPQEVILLRIHGHVIIKVFTRLLAHSGFDGDQLSEPLDFLVLRNHDIGSLGGSCLHHRLE
jgi:hypothetical protein